MKKKLDWRLLGVAGVCLVLASCKPESEGFKIPLIAADASGKPVQHWVNGADFKEQLTQSSITLRDSIVETMDRREARGNWMVRSFTVGIGVSAEIGFGPFKVGAAPRFHLGFTNSTKPPMP